ncbi:senescence-associated carboxylesterase 101-like [Senna tora]|uniref:Senescence-associated carboxylesterase 101-like n=1 Tax=Senna tora TaxID=362788 RepID=A0A834SG68_9FABA|nr:senescence-associated carboxylesterase 101-like [Senna tora]
MRAYFLRLTKASPMVVSDGLLRWSSSGVLVFSDVVRCSGLECAYLVASSGLLSRSWKVISGIINSKEKLFWRVHQDSDLTIVGFVSSAQNDVVSDDRLVSSSDLMDSPFGFLCTKSIPSFCVNQSVISLFNEYRPMLEDLKSQLKPQIDLSKPLIITGHALGGSIASLFTLWLLDSVSKKHPLCITFGSPLIGDKNLQQAISRSSIWNSCFLHVASRDDPLPSSLISSNNSPYKPFGTFLLCSDYGSSCFENPESILMLLRAMRPINQGLKIFGYENVVESLNCKAICKDDTSAVDVSHLKELQVSLTLQLWALGFAHVKNIDIKTLAKDIEKQEMIYILKKRKVFDPSRKLNDVKINMAQLEWYKKISKTHKRGYYDSFKKGESTSDLDTVTFIKTLNNYWRDMVAEAEMKPQKEGTKFRTRWLYAGTNYRRMVEPLDIAQYYKDGGRDYVTRGRSEHYRQLEKWVEEEEKPDSISRHNVESILTLDSLFWAHVEEALILCKKLKGGMSHCGEAEKEVVKQKLVKFEDYVYGELKKYAVSPEIFLEGSSFMSWWKEYVGTLESGYDSRLFNFMRNVANRQQYETGVYDFP